MAPHITQAAGRAWAAMLVLPLPSWVAAQPSAAEVNAACDVREAMQLVVYPPKALQCGLEGVARVRFRVGRDGGVEESVIYSSTNRIFNRPALEAIKQVRCNASVAGTSIKIPFEFKIKDGRASPKDRATACVDDKRLQAADSGGA